MKFEYKTSGNLNIELLGAINASGLSLSQFARAVGYKKGRVSQVLHGYPMPKKMAERTKQLGGAEHGAAF